MNKFHLVKSFVKKHIIWQALSQQGPLALNILTQGANYP